MNEIFLKLNRRKQIFIEKKNDETLLYDNNNNSNNDDLNDALVYVQACNRCNITIDCTKVDKIIMERCSEVTLTVNSGVKTSTVEVFKTVNSRLHLNDASGVQLLTLDECSQTDIHISTQLTSDLSIIHADSCTVVRVNDQLLQQAATPSSAELEESLTADDQIDPRLTVIGKQYKSYWNDRNELVSEYVLREGAHCYATTASELKHRKN